MLRPCNIGIVFATALSLILPPAVSGDGDDTAGGAQLRIATEPSGARIYHNGRLADTAPVTLENLTPGIHLIAAQLPGYHEERATVTLEAGQRHPLDLRLRAITGLILLHSTPVGADITINGAHRGQTPLLVTDLPIGRYRATATLPGYLPMEIDITVENRTPQRVELPLRSDTARFRFDSTPRGARVYINGVLRGTTPCEVDRVPSGDSEIEIQSEGHQSFRQRFNLQAGDEHDIRVELDPLPGTLRLTSIPDGARIYINDEPHGETPLQIDDMPPGVYPVRAEARGYAPETINVTVRHGAVTAREIRLRRDSGTIVMTTEPAGVRVLIDGREAGTTQPGESEMLSLPLTMDLVAQGNRKLQLSRPGYYPHEINVEVGVGATVTRHERLRRRFIPDTRVRIGDGPGDVLTGIITQRFPNGDIEIEIRPGIFRTIEKDRIQAIDPITTRPPAD